MPWYDTLSIAGLTFIAGLIYIVTQSPSSTEDLSPLAENTNWWVRELREAYRGLPPEVQGFIHSLLDLISFLHGILSSGPCQALIILVVVVRHLWTYYALRRNRRLAAAQEKEDDKTDKDQVEDGNEAELAGDNRSNSSGRQFIVEVVAEEVVDKEVCDNQNGDDAEVRRPRRRFSPLKITATYRDSTPEKSPDHRGTSRIPKLKKNK